MKKELVMFSGKGDANFFLGPPLESGRRDAKCTFWRINVGLRLDPYQEPGQLIYLTPYLLQGLPSAWHIRVPLSLSQLQFIPENFISRSYFLSINFYYVRKVYHVISIQSSYFP